MNNNIFDDDKKMLITEYITLLIFTDYFKLKLSSFKYINKYFKFYILYETSISRESKYITFLYSRVRSYLNLTSKESNDSSQQYQQLDNILFDLDRDNQHSKRKLFDSIIKINIKIFTTVATFISFNWHLRCDIEGEKNRKHFASFHSSYLYRIFNEMMNHRNNDNNFESMQYLMDILYLFSYCQIIRYMKKHQKSKMVEKLKHKLTLYKCEYLYYDRFDTNANTINLNSSAPSIEYHDIDNILCISKDCFDIIWDYFYINYNRDYLLKYIFKNK